MPQLRKHRKLSELLEAAMPAYIAQGDKLIEQGPPQHHEPYMCDQFIPHNGFTADEISRFEAWIGQYLLSSGGSLGFSLGLPIGSRESVLARRMWYLNKIEELKAQGE